MPLFGPTKTKRMRTLTLTAETITQQRPHKRRSQQGRRRMWSPRA